MSIFSNFLNSIDPVARKKAEEAEARRRQKEAADRKTAQVHRETKEMMYTSRVSGMIAQEITEFLKSNEKCVIVGRNWQTPKEPITPSEAIKTSGLSVFVFRGCVAVSSVYFVPSREKGDYLFGFEERGFVNLDYLHCQYLAEFIREYLQRQLGPNYHFSEVSYSPRSSNCYGTEFPSCHSFSISYKEPEPEKEKKPLSGW